MALENLANILVTKYRQSQPPSKTKKLDGRKIPTPVFMLTLGYNVISSTDAKIVYNCNCGKVHSESIVDISLLKGCEDLVKQVDSIFKAQDHFITAYTNPYNIKYACGCGQEHTTDIYTAKHKSLKCPFVKRRGRLYLWKKKVLQQDEYLCSKCGTESNLHIHHIENYRRRPELAADPKNGITFCEDCHNLFHAMYGYTTTFPKLVNFLNRSLSENF